MASRHKLEHVHLEHPPKPDIHEGFEVTAAPQIRCGFCGDCISFFAKPVGRVRKAKYKGNRVLVEQGLCEQGHLIRLDARLRREIARRAKREMEWYIFFVQHPVDDTQIKTISESELPD